MFEQRRGGGRWTALHHPFTAPEGDLDGDPGALRSRAYDLVLDGIEIGGGSIRITPPDVQQRGLRAARHERRGGAARASASCSTRCATARRRTAASRWGSTASSRCSAACESIRDVIAFPKTASGADPLTGAPAPVDARQLRELALRSLVEPAPGAGAEGWGDAVGGRTAP